MAINAELYSFPDEASIRRKLISWFNDRYIDIDRHMSTEALLQLYRDIECGKYL